MKRIKKNNSLKKGQFKKIPCSGLPIELPIELSIELPSGLPIELSFELLIEFSIQLLLEFKCLEDAFWTSFSNFLGSFWDPFRRLWDAFSNPGHPGEPF